MQKDKWTKQAKQASAPEQFNNNWITQLGGINNTSDQNDSTREASNRTESAKERIKIDKVNKYIVFFSWQSDIEEQKNKIGKILEDQLWNLSQKLDCHFKFDSDTRGVPGMKNIPDEVETKINNCHIFICDLTPVTTILDKSGKKKAMPNSNVMFELGKATNCLPSEQIIGIVNKDGEEWNIGDMPFDIHHRKMIYFSLEDDLNSLLRDQIEKSVKYIEDKNK